MSMCYISHCNLSVNAMIFIMASDITVAEKISKMIVVSLA
jgi:hypothetical protein